MAPVMRALLVALDEWVEKGVEPPPSVYPDVRNDTLGTLQVAADAFPLIPNVSFPTDVNELYTFDHGPLFSSRGGRLTLMPPVRGRRYEVLVPMPDRDGHDLAGVKTVDVAVPVGTKVNSTGRRNTSMMRCCDAETETETVRPGGSACDAFAWSAAGNGACGAATVLEGDRAGAVE